MAASRATAHPVILTYHSISEGDSPLKVSPKLFAEQMEWLAAVKLHNLRVISLTELMDHWGDVASLEPGCVVLTFDDGYADFHSNAAPVLLRLKLPATVFLPTAFVGRTNAWPGQPAWVKEEWLMDWEQIRELSEAGIDFGSHTAGHPNLCSLDRATVERELTESKHEIEQRLGRPVRHFCYPYGKWNRSVRASTARHYLSACTTIAGTVGAESDRQLLPRVDAHYVRNPRWFRAMFTRRFEAYIATRRLIRRARGQPEGGYPSG